MAFAWREEGDASTGSSKGRETGSLPAKRRDPQKIQSG